jgi:plastocyanin
MIKAKTNLLLFRCCFLVAFPFLHFPNHPAAAEESDSQTRSEPPFTKPGLIEGTVLFRGVPPKNPIPDDAGFRRDLIQVHRQTGGIRDVLAYLEPDPKLQPAPGQKKASRPLLMDQVDHQFVPRVMAVLAHAPITFTNSDPANHNVRTSSDQRKNEFNVYTGVGGKYQHDFQPHPKNKPVRVSCDIHPWMRAWIYVMEHPFFAVTASEGQFQIAGVPPGDYHLILVQPDLRHASTQQVQVVSGTTNRLTLEINAAPAISPHPGK